MTQNKKVLAAGAALVVLIGLFMGLYLATRPETQVGKKTFTLEVVHSDQSEKSFTYTTDMEFVGEVLQAEGLLLGEEGPYGLYISSVDGEEAIYEESGAYWSFYEGEEYAVQGIDLTPVQDGAQYALVYTIG